MGTWQVEDLGVQARGDLWMNVRHGVRPADGADVALCSLSHGGFMVIDPHARTALQVPRDVPEGQGWAIGQAPDGRIWQTGFSRGRHVRLHCWDWQAETSRTVVELPGDSFFTLDVGPDGTVYLPDYSTNTLYGYTPAAQRVDSLGDFGAFGKHIRNVCAAADGWVYLTCVDGAGHVIVAVEPASGQRRLVEPCGAASQDWQSGQLLKDGAGRVLAGTTRWGRPCWYELQGGERAATPHACPQLAATVIRQSASPPRASTTSLAFSDGSYVSLLSDTTCEITGADGQRHSFAHDRRDAPLRIFSIISGGDSIWGGTFIPLTLFSYEPATGESHGYGNCTRSTGEIYAMAWSRHKLYMASYTGAAITRYEPGLPWQPEAAASNPVHLGRMKEETPFLHRIYGQAVDPDGVVYFAAKGDYGCTDSGITRVNPADDTLTRWIYPQTTFGALCYLPTPAELLVAERRDGEACIRFTRIDPENGEILGSRPMIEDAGHIISWLVAEGSRVYGLHNHRATLFLYDAASGEIVASAAELGVGDHCYNALVDGLDGRVWGLTNQCVYAAARDLSGVEPLVEYKTDADGNFYRFGLVTGPDGAVYFPDGTHLLRIKRSPSG